MGNREALALLVTRSWMRDYASLSRWLIRPAAQHRSIPTLYLSSPPSGCNPDSDSSALSLSIFRPVIAGSESTWLGILTPIQVNVPHGLLFNCQDSMKGFLKCPFTFTGQTTGFLGGTFSRKIDFVIFDPSSCNESGITQRQKLDSFDF